MLDHLDSPTGTSWYLWLFSFKYSFGFCTSCTPTFFLPLPGPTMVVDRDEKWMPVLPCNPSRAMGPSSSAPAGRSCSGGSETPSPPNSSDDEASSSWNITSRCSPNPSRRIYVHEVDVGIVLGIPNGDIDVSTTSVTGANILCRQ
ncbi:hypothetical protein GQ55_3G329900 [Panicum hallii var. hallii]|uniref:Uncharacterized protein n=1 Tax=Panicum hallii var. hallii TaxID=1504633 RepID=A0A2T7EFI3_9POAL|nr:hypothetical protein GQ55_3G329900 [Panicum hallii var. hallii]